VHNSAVATGTPEGGDPVQSAPATADLPTPDPQPALGFEKTATLDDTNGNGVGAPGEEITYGFVVRNTGNMTINQIQVDDPAVGAVSCTSSTLAPGAQTTCTAAPRTITGSDIAGGATLSNTARARGTDPAGDPVESDPATAAAPLARPLPPASVHRGGANNPSSNDPNPNTNRYAKKNRDCREDRAHRTDRRDCERRSGRGR
jgi:uncharacterized repeat protein (TIGR01451 family)